MTTKIRHKAKRTRSTAAKAQALPWFRLYTEFATDPKVQLLAFEDQRHFLIVLCMKRNGTLDAFHETEEIRQRVIAKTLGLDLVSCGEVNRRLREVGIIDANWQPKAWNARQFLSDSSTERVRQFRSRSRNATETLHDRSSNGGVTPSDTDTEADAEAPSESSSRNSTSVAFSSSSRARGSDRANQENEEPGEQHRTARGFPLTAQHWRPATYRHTRTDITLDDLLRAFHAWVAADEVQSADWEATFAGFAKRHRPSDAEIASAKGADRDQSAGAMAAIRERLQV